MTDEIDRAQEYESRMTEAAISHARANAEMAKGVPGECEFCGEWSGRLVNCACAPCRDKYKLG